MARHWSEKYISITYKQMNCSKFCEHVLREEFGIDFNFPQSKGSLFAQSQQIRDELPVYCDRTDTPKDGDLILMHGRRLMCHVGLYVKIGITEYVLHTESSLESAVLQPLKSLINFGYSVEGFYKWRK